MTTCISITDIGPIQKLSIPVPPGGGVVVLRGPNGSGKTNALNATESLLKRGKGGKPIEVREEKLADGAVVQAKRGEVSGFGAQLNVARRTTCVGAEELDVVSLEGRLDVSQVVDPGIKDPGAADAKRIKALLSLSGLTPNDSEFQKLAASPEEWLTIVSKEELDGCTDFVELADKIKRRFEKAARTAEDNASNLMRSAQAKKSQADGVDTSDAKPAAYLMAQLNDANEKLTALLERQRLAEQSKESHDSAKTALQNAIDSYEGLSVEEAEESVKAHENNHNASLDDFRKAEAALNAAKIRASDAAKELGFANERYTAAKNHELSLKGWQSAIESAAIEPVPETDLEYAKAHVRNCQDAVERGAVARKACEAIAEAEALSTKGLEAQSTANRLRDAAKGTDEILSGLVERVGSNLRVESGRLVTNTESRGPTYFAELSSGERWTIALDIATDAVGESGLIVIPQEAWEGLDGKNRKLVADHAKSRKVVVLTAEATRDEEGAKEIRAEVVA